MPRPAPPPRVAAGACRAYGFGMRDSRPLTACVPTAAPSCAISPTARTAVVTVSTGEASLVADLPARTRKGGHLYVFSLQGKRP